MRVTPRKCVPPPNACLKIYTGSKRTSGRNHHVRPPFTVWRKRYINLNLWGPCLKWSLKSRSPQHDSGWQQSERTCGSLSKYIGLSSYRIYAIHGKVSHQGHHTNGLCYQLQICCDWMLFTPSQGYYTSFDVYEFKWYTIAIRTLDFAVLLIVFIVLLWRRLKFSLR